MIRQCFRIMNKWMDRHEGPLPDYLMRRARQERRQQCWLNIRSMRSKNWSVKRHRIIVDSSRARSRTPSINSIKRCNVWRTWSELLISASTPTEQHRFEIVDEDSASWKLHCELSSREEFSYLFSTFRLLIFPAGTLKQYVGDWKSSALVILDGL